MVHSQRAGIPREPASHLDMPKIKICSCRKRLTSTTLLHHLGLINYMLAHLHVSGRTLNVINEMRRELEDVLGLTEGSFDRGTSLSTQRIHQVALASTLFLNTSCPTAECVGAWIEIGKICDRRTPWEITGTLCPSTPVLDMPQPHLPGKSSTNGGLGEGQALSSRDANQGGSENSLKSTLS
jgi:hypothetical protein